LVARRAAGLQPHAADPNAAGLGVDKDVGLQLHLGDAAAVLLSRVGLSTVVLLRITANYCKPGFAVMPAGVVRAHMCAAMVGAIHVEKGVGLAPYGTADAMDGDKGAWLTAHSVGAHVDKDVVLGALADDAYADKGVGLLAAFVLAYVEKSVWSRPHPLRMQGASRLL
jgi:hypothetical protein